MNEIAPGRRQMQAQRAYERVSSKESAENSKEYSQFSKRFPALVHSCGLAQAVSFAQAKGFDAYLSDLAYVMEVGTSEDLEKDSRIADVIRYQHLSRQAIASATWLMRYSEALLEEK